ncbi:cytochrome P450 [Ramlibacter alkalitolerans]|uniref:Cytochrome P450 n=1 Tax=Ramlibacter alkalitolerans TaxID=2039631 RepID=A0ABS1JW17_9BURK|nr:cytochrome P450 [Ramlibacter alkalitolerans]MBL0428500.1 cytochrome P450 [Ramlibacter alkalitolerans]
MAQALSAPGPTERHDLDANDESLSLLLQWLAQYGNTFRVPSLTRPVDALVINDPDDIRRVLLTHRANYVKGAGLERVRMLVGNGLIVSEGEAWARQRHRMQPMFQGSANRAFAPMIQDLQADLVARWAVRAGSGEPIDLTRELSAVALEVVLRALFSVDFDRLVLAEGSNPFDFLAEESVRDLRFAARFRALGRFVRDIVDARRHEGRSEADWLSMLMHARDKGGEAPMAERALVDEALTLIIAGHETTASTLNWTWYLLSQHPQVQRELQAAVDAPSALPLAAESVPGETAAGSYVEQVLQEALRLYPPVWLFSRRAVGDDTLGGHPVPAGTDIFISPYLLHRSAAHWESPEAFVPERFAPGAAAGRHRFAYLPFSAGPRFCIGAGFAMAEMAMHLAMVARRFELQYCGTAPAEPEFHINLRTRHPVRMRLIART